MTLARLGSLLVAIVSAPVAAAPGPLQAAIGDPGFLHLSGSLRARAEIIAGQPRTGFRDAESLISLRTTLRADLGNGPVRLVAEMFDSRAYGIARGGAVGTGEVNTLEFVQAHVAADLGAALGRDTRLTAQAGRMVLNLGSRRLIAADDYRNTTNGYTGVRIDAARGPDLAATVIYVLPQVRLPDNIAAIRRNRAEVDREGLDLRLWGGIASWHHALGSTDAELSFYRLDERDSPALATRDRHLSTLDLRVMKAPAVDHFDHEIEAAWQWGAERPGVAAALPAQQVAAGFVHADAGYSLAHARLSAEFDFASGDRPGGKYTRFDTLFGMRRADFSPGALLAAIGRANLVAAGARVEVTPSARSDGHVTAQAMWAASASDAFATSGVRDPRPGASAFAGYELDSRWRHWLVPGRLRAEWNGTLLLHRGLLRTAPNAPAAPTTVYTSLALLTLF